jgi:hypothetical protein
MKLFARVLMILSIAILLSPPGTADGPGQIGPPVRVKGPVRSAAPHVLTSP